MEGLRWRTFVAVLGVAASLVWVLPNLVNLSEVSWWPSKQKLNYGLDIQGGLHLVMGVDVDGVVKESTTRLISTIKAEMTKDNVAYADVKSEKPESGEVQVVVADAAGKAAVEKFISDKYSTVLQVVSSTDTSVTARYFDAYLNDYKNRVIQQSIETIRNRIDEFGVAEPSISQQGANRILIQLPGMADAEKAKQLINTTAKLDFMIVSHEKTPQELQVMIAEVEKAGNFNMENTKYSDYVTRVNEALAGKLPEKTVVYFEKAPNATTIDAGAIPYLLKTDTDLGGGALDDAFVGYDQYGSPQVSLQFNSAGAQKFADLTGNNVGKQMAIVLDKIVKSAPSVRDRIAGGSAVITLGGGRDRNGMMEEAKMISTSLRAGALPASLEQLEERRVGPTLGADAIGKAKLGSYVGAAIIIIFMIAYYKSMGVVASVALGLNILGIFALLTTFGATLTLPGIAGIALTVGFAVDANVLINERIREELRMGHGIKVAVAEGYNRAMSAIIDANVTTAATAVVLLYFGTGPVRGFAVTLLIGIVTSMFANVFVSKVIVDTLVNKFNLKKLSV
ncbi:protein translocase subunit SecD [Bdellovibrio bacteriovorus]|uniref:Protein translocase subunit SecD n=1 Tax=Bdellovibrio bacteriovorus (strain ATCC 15356 / DSM 50701 / NCIMB 9529 / HD100) TaxID=264462 RepID=Q6MKZ2_BDEBA|nr:protein translocase subunit SecD [Bdellovibrio bacteriovorus]AHZ84769.1 SecD, protein-export membrane protein [Bdellovibrio bacteriovorus]BEV68656.1 Protein translocase subunit SecD [Bdellovibrio bacteriovorus]CAE80065.1 SecD, protein-export membrane protein [Bdellovibrio bacteriovorus HD100]